MTAEDSVAGQRNQRPGRPGGDDPVKTESPANSSTHEDVLAALRHLLAFFGKSTPIEALLAGLPLDNGRMTHALIGRALERANLAVQPFDSSLALLPEFDMPAIFVGPKGRLMVCVEREPTGALRCFSAEANEEFLVGVEDPEVKRNRTLILVKPKSEPAAFQASKARHWLRAAFSGHKRSILHVALAAAFINVFAIAMPLFTMNVYDRVLPNKAVSTLWVLAIGLLIVLLFDLLLKVSRGALIDHIGRTIDFRLSSVLYDRVINTAIAARPPSVGAFINRISQYEVLREFFTSNTIVMFVDILFLGVFVYVIASLIGWVVVFPLLAGLICITFTIIVGIRSGRAIKAALEESSQRNSILVETLSSAQTVKASRAEGHFLRRWETAILASSETQSAIKTYQSAATQFTAAMGQVSSITIVIAGTYLFSDGALTMGAIIAAMMLSNRLIAPISQISAALLRTRSAIEAYQTLNAIIELPDERSTGQSFVRRAIKTGRVEFRKVRFAYPGSQQFVLDQVSFLIEPGEKVGIIGRIGSGKTTLGRMLVNFYAPSEGEILVDGVAISQYHPAELRRQVGFVLQDPELFSGTLRENILLSDPTASDERLVTAARRAGVEDFVARHPAGYDMPVGEKGCLLSGGQRQAVAIARTMLVEPKILFLDEPSSSMDLATERQLIQHLSKSLAPDDTVLIATHRHSLLSLVTRLIVIDNGRIVADGPRDAVLAQLTSGGGGS